MSWLRHLARYVRTMLRHIADTEPARLRAAATAVLTALSALGVTVAADLPARIDAIIAIIAILVPLVQGEVTRGAVYSPASYRQALAAPPPSDVVQR